MVTARGEDHLPGRLEGAEAVPADSSPARGQLLIPYRALHSPSAPASARVPAQTRLRSSHERLRMPSPTMR